MHARLSDRPVFDSRRDDTGNWYSGNAGALGAPDGGPDKGWANPHFRVPASALLGFDEAIDRKCRRHGNHAESCVRANYNILALYGDHIPYNTCRNMEWQICAAKGTLPKQDGDQIIFAYAPKDLRPEKGPHPIGSCEGYHPAGCGDDGLASSDIFYLEACIYSMMCSNREELFQIDAGDIWRCHMDPHGYERLKGWVLAGLS